MVLLIHFRYQVFHLTRS